MSLYEQYKPEFPLVAMMIWMKNGCIQMDKAGMKEIVKKKQQATYIKSYV